MIVNNQSNRLVKHIIRSYARLSENSRVKGILKENLPSVLKEKSFSQNLDESSRRWLQNIHKNLGNTNNNRNLSQDKNFNSFSRTNNNEIYYPLSNINSTPNNNNNNNNNNNEQRENGFSFNSNNLK